MNKTFSRVGAFGALTLASVSSFAAIDVTAATTGITDAQVAVLAVMVESGSTFRQSLMVPALRYKLTLGLVTR